MGVADDGVVRNPEIVSVEHSFDSGDGGADEKPASPGRGRVR
jgi:hypothetical protein